MTKVPDYSDWIPAKVNAFWGRIARHDHVVQLYQDDEVFFDTVTGFVQNVIDSNENAVVIANEPHLNGLEARMEAKGFHIDQLISDGHFIPLDVEEVIAEFMTDGQVDESRLSETMSNFFARASSNRRAFRLCGEIAPTLLAQGYTQLASRVEHIGDSINRDNPTCIYCAYSKKLFEREGADLTNLICDTHSKLISGSERQLTHIFYQDTKQKHYH